MRTGASSPIARAPVVALGLGLGLGLRLGLGLACGAALAGCVGGDGGAIVVRWRVVDQATGSLFSGCEVPPHDGIDTQVSIDTVRLRVAVQGAAAGGADPCPSCRFPCDPPEHTTRYEIPAATYRISLEALRCGATVGLTPPAIVRTIRAGEVTNLNAIEILIPPGTHTVPTRPGVPCPVASGSTVDGAAL